MSYTNDTTFPIRDYGSQTITTGRPPTLSTSSISYVSDTTRILIDRITKELEETHAGQTVVVRVVSEQTENPTVLGQLIFQWKLESLKHEYISFNAYFENFILSELSPDIFSSFPYVDFTVERVRNIIAEEKENKEEEYAIRRAEMMKLVERVKEEESRMPPDQPRIKWHQAADGNFGIL